MRVTQARNFGLVLIVALLLISAWYVLWVRIPDASTSLQRGHYKEAYKKLQIAAHEDDAEAQLKLGNMFYVGLGMDRDYDLALSWFHRSAMQGNSAAQYNMGIMNLQGLGAQIDLVQATAWFLVASETGEPLDSETINSKTQLRKLSGTLSPNKLQQANEIHQNTLVQIEQNQ